jgi:hypothetical protein
VVQVAFGPALLPQFHLALPSGDFGPSDLMTVTATITPGATVVADVYLALELADTSLLFLNPDGGLTPAPTPLVTNWSVTAYTGPVFSYAFTGTEPAGTYRWLAALMAPGTLSPITGITEASVSVWSAAEPALRVYLNRRSLRSGDPLAIGLTLDAAPAPVDRDVYVALQLPDGSLLFLTETGTATPTATPYLTHWTGTALVRRAFAYTFTGGEPAGPYRVLAGFAHPGTTNFLGPIVTAPFEFAP